MGAKQKATSRPNPRTSTGRGELERTIDHTKNTRDQEEYCKIWKVLMRDRVEDANEEFASNHRDFRSQVVKSRRSPRFRVRAKMNGQDVFKQAMRVKLRQLEDLEKTFSKHVNGFPVEARQTVKDVIDMYKCEEDALGSNARGNVAGKTVELRTKEARLKKLCEQIAHFRKKSQAKRKPAKISSAAPSSSTGSHANKRTKEFCALSSSSTISHANNTVWHGVRRPKRSHFIGTWEAVCDGVSFFVTVDAAGGVISRKGYSEQFTIFGDGTPNSKYSIHLGVERWDLSNMPGPSKLNWMGKVSGLISRWTKKSELPEVVAKGQIGGGGASRCLPNAGKKTRSEVMAKAKSKSFRKVSAKARCKRLATAPPEGRGVSPVSPSLLPRQTLQMPTPEGRRTFGSDADTTPDFGKDSKSPIDHSELLSEISEFVEPPRRVILSDPFLTGFPLSPAPALDDMPEPSKTHLEELIDSEAYADMAPFTKRGFAETAF